jgi:DNA-binding XRE family transcriptional regulator
MSSVSAVHHEAPPEAIGRRLRRLRHERGMSQRDLAEPSEKLLGANAEPLAAEVQTHRAET